MTVESDKLQKKSKKISKSAILKHFTEPPMRVIVYSVTDSTNTQAKALLRQGEQPPFLLVAEEQTAGRGRHGHTFFSPESGMYFTLAIKPENLDLALQKATVAAAVSLRETIEQLTGLKCEIKWVNDLYLNQRKIAGILCEAPRDSHGQIAGIIIGIGVNVCQKVFPEEIKDTAGSLGMPDLDRNHLAALLTERLLYWLAHLGDPSLIREYKKHSLLLGKNVTFSINGRQITGIAADINEDGNLIVTADETYTLNSGEISLLSWQK